MVELKNNELAVLMRLIVKEDEAIEFIPEKVIDGTYIESDKLFINYTTGNTYYHMGEILLAEDIPTYENVIFYALRDTKENLQNQYPELSIDEIKEEMLKNSLQYIYYIGIELNPLSEFEILTINKETGAVKLFKDTDLQDNIIHQTTLEVGYTDEKDTIYNESQTEKFQISFKPYDLSQKIKEEIFGQDDAINKVVQSLWSNYTFIDDEEYNKENMLLIGASGVGKTAIFQTIEKILPEIPVYIADLSPVTESGMQGDSLDDIIKGLLMKCIEIKNGVQFVNLQKASHAIIVLDEFDKIAKSQSINDSNIGNESVQQELLKLIEGKEMLIKMNLNGIQQTIPINTKNITFVCCGAFDEITKNKEKKMGFNQDVSQNNKDKSYKEVTEEDIKKYGFITELIGRIPAIIRLNELSLETLIQILKKPRRSLFIKKLKLLKTIVEEVEIKEDLYEEIAKNAIKKKTGARGLDKVSVDLFNEILVEIQNPEYEYKYAMLDKKTVTNPKKYELKKFKRC